MSQCSHMRDEEEEESIFLKEETWWDGVCILFPDSGKLG